MRDSPGLANFTSSCWVGKNRSKGLAVLARGGYSLAIHAAYRPRHRWIVPIQVSGPRSFLLFAVWTLPSTVGGSYSRTACTALRAYEHLLDAQPVVWAGDFNAGTAYDRERDRYRFADLVTRLEAHDIVSAYHWFFDCPHGAEPHPTYFHHFRPERPFHIDYIFASRSLLAPGCTVSIGAYADWRHASDHVPLTCTLGCGANRA